MTERMTRTLVDASLDHWISDLANDTKRTLRRLLELGTLFSKGSRQKAFFTMAEDVFSDRRCAWYDLIGALVKNVRPEILKQFGMNFGYVGLSRGAKARKAFAAKAHAAAPSWAVIWRAGETPLQQFVENATRVHTNVFFVFLEENSMEEFYRVARLFSDCAFVGFLPLIDVSNDLLIPPETLCNVMTVVPAQDPHAKEEAAVLYAAKRLFGEYALYQTVEEGSAALSSAPLPHCLFRILSATPGAFGGVTETVGKQIYEKRKTRPEAVFPMELSCDILLVDQLCAGVSSSAAIF